MRVAINGFGRIGRLIFRIMDEDPDIEIVAINDLTDAEQLAYLLKYDTNHRNYKVDEISFKDDYIIVGNKKIKVLVEDCGKYCAQFIWFHNSINGRKILNWWTNLCIEWYNSG